MFGFTWWWGMRLSEDAAYPGRPAPEAIDWIERLVGCVRRGESLELHPMQAQVDQVHPAAADFWPGARCIPASAVRAVILREELKDCTYGLRIRGAHLLGLVDLGYVDMPWPVHLLECRLSSGADLRCAHFVELNLTKTYVRRIELDRSVVERQTVLDGLRATQGVSATGAHLGSLLSLKNAVLVNERGPSLSLDRGHVEGDADLRGMRATGRLFAPGATMTGALKLDDAVLHAGAGEALNLDRARVEGGVSLERATVVGGVKAPGLKTSGPFDCAGAVLSSRNERSALSLDGAEVDGDVWLNNVQATGEVRALGSQICGQLNLKNAVFFSRSAPAISLDRATVKENAVLTGVAVAGEVRAPGSHFLGHLALDGATLSYPSGRALNLQGAQVHVLWLRDVKEFHGYAELSGVKIEHLVVDKKVAAKGLPKPLSAAGWRIGSIEGALRSDASAVTVWLDRRPAGVNFSAQPWHEIASLYERNGQPAEARKLRWQAARRTTREMKTWTKPSRVCYGALVGHGYYPLVAAAWLTVALVLAMSVSAANRDGFMATNAAAALDAVQSNASTERPRLPEPVTAATQCEDLSPRYSCFNPTVYALATVIPPAAAVQNMAWAPDPAREGLIWSLTALKGAGWLLTALLLAGVTGLLRKA